MPSTLSRRKFLHLFGASSAFISVGLTGCGSGGSDPATTVPGGSIGEGTPPGSGDTGGGDTGTPPGNGDTGGEDTGGTPVDSENLEVPEVDPNATTALGFIHGVASGDPLSNAAIIWTRVSPVSTTDTIQVGWHVALDAEFTQVINSGTLSTDESRDFTVKVDAAELPLDGTMYYYRFFCLGEATETERVTATGTFKTLPVNDITNVRLMVFSCSRMWEGYFNVYNDALKHENMDAVLFLGDYIYEYAPDYGPQERQDATYPKNSLQSLTDYRQRYASHRTDENLKELHQKLPFIAVWDDHEIFNNVWNNSEDLSSREIAATQAYFEWMPIRPAAEDDTLHIYRHFQWGNLLDLMMVDTRMEGRDRTLDYVTYGSTTSNFDESGFRADLENQSRNMISDQQFSWLEGKLTTSTTRWQMIGQQVLMSEMHVPLELALAVDSKNGSYIGNLTDADKIRLATANRTHPINLDQWDGYPAERDRVFNAARLSGNNLLVVSGDSHNAWANNLVDSRKNAIGVELGVSSVTSSGLEGDIGVGEAEEILVSTVLDNNVYTNLKNRGYALVDISAQQTRCEWHFVSSIGSPDYLPLDERKKVLACNYGNRKFS